MSCRRCASSPGPTPFSTASGSSPPATPTSSATGGSSRGSDSPPRAMKRVASALETELARLARLELRRSRTTVEAFPASDTRAVALRGGRRLIDFSSNDYLGLARHPALGAAMSACAARTGAGSGASHLITGHGAEHELLEEALAAFTHRERALVFSTGYMANLAVLATLAGRGERVLLDRLSHASLIDGARLSGAELGRYPHADAGAAARLLARAPGRTALLGTDGVFSMDGDLAPLPELSRAARDADARPRLPHRRRAAPRRGAPALPPRRRRRRGAPAGARSGPDRAPRPRRPPPPGRGSPPPPGAPPPAPTTPSPCASSTTSQASASR